LLSLLLLLRRSDKKDTRFQMLDHIRVVIVGAVGGGGDDKVPFFGQQSRLKSRRDVVFMAEKGVLGDSSAIK
jgi:hypothetical protein